MGKTFDAGCKFMLAAMLAMLAAACQPRTVPDPVGDEAAIRALLETIAADFNAGRIDDMLGRYLDDVLVSAPGAPDIIGKAAWRDALATSLPAGVPMTLRFDTAEMAIDGDLAYERGTYVIEVPVAEAPLRIEGRHIHLFRRQPDGSWKGWRLMENSADPATSPVPAAVRP